MKIKCLLLFLLLGANQLVSYAEPVQVSPASDLAAALQDLTKVTGFSCRFEQVLSYAEGGKRSYSGKLAVLRPGKFRWQYIKPYEQLYVGDGKSIWLYEPDLMQAQHLQDLGEVEPVVMQLLDGRVGLDDVQVLSEQDLGKTESSWLVLVGAGEEQVEIYLGVKAKKLAWIESQDVLGNRNRLQLFDVDKHHPPEELFIFKAPAGVDIIGE